MVTMDNVFAVILVQEQKWATILERANTTTALAPRQRRLLVAEAEGALKALGDVRAKLMDPPCGPS